MEKVKNEKDFDKLSFHDSIIYSMTFPDLHCSFKFDLDYIIEWRQPDDGYHFQFLVAPAILSFKSTTDLKIQLEFENYVELFIEDVRRENKRLTPKQHEEWDYIIITDRGEIKFTAVGFDLYFTGEPKLSDSQKYDRLGNSSDRK